MKYTIAITNIPQNNKYPDPKICPIGGKVEFINPHYREIRTMGGCTNNRTRYTIFQKKD